jgi:purine nucleosidase
LEDGQTGRFQSAFFLASAGDLTFMLKNRTFMRKRSRRVLRAIDSRLGGSPGENFRRRCTGAEATGYCGAPLRGANVGRCFLVLRLKVAWVFKRRGWENLSKKCCRPCFSLLLGLTRVCAKYSFAPSGLAHFLLFTHGLRRGLHSYAASRLKPEFLCRSRGLHSYAASRLKPEFLYRSRGLHSYAASRLEPEFLCHSRGLDSYAASRLEPEFLCHCRGLHSYAASRLEPEFLCHSDSVIRVRTLTAMPHIISPLRGCDLRTGIPSVFFERWFSRTHWRPRGFRPGQSNFGLILTLLLLTSFSAAQARRKVIINEDCSGPGGSNMQTLAVLIQSPQVEVLGITVASGDQWRDEEVAHTLRLLEILGRTDIPVVPGAEFPLVRRRDEAQRWQQLYGKVAYAGAWDDRWRHEPSVIPPMPEGQPTTKPAEEDAPHFLIRMVRKYPHEVTIYEGAPMTNLALAVSIDPHFPELAEGLVFMGGSVQPQTENPEFVNNPRHEFNFWFDPEAAEIVLTAPWKKIVCTPTDVSIKTHMSAAMVKQIEAAGTPLARYIAKFAMLTPGADIMWDELAAEAWLDPTIITKSETRYMTVDIDRGAGYGNTLTWSLSEGAKQDARPVEIQFDLDRERFYRMFVRLMTATTPGR